MDDRAFREALQDAVIRRDHLRDELASLKKRIADLDLFINAAERVLHERDQEANHDFSTPNSDSLDSGPHATSVRRHRNSYSPSRIAELAAEEILAQGRPMTRGELVAALERRGVEMVAKDKAKNLGTILWRFSDRFENLPGQGYWPKGHPPPGKFV